MRPSSIRFRLAIGAVAVAAALAGCRTPPAAQGFSAEPTELPALGPVPAARAEALARFGRGIIAEYNRDFPAALTNYQAAVRFDPDNEDLQLRIAIGLLQEKKLDEALTLVEDLSRRHPESERAQLVLALLYRATDRNDQVERVYRRLIQMAPAKPDVYIELASLYINDRRDRQAIALLDQGLRKSTNRVDLLRMLGGIYLQRLSNKNLKSDEPKNRQLAIRTLERAAAEATNDIPILFQLGDLYIRDGRASKAVECFERIESISPDNLQIRQRLAMSFLALGNADKAIAALEELSIQSPGNALLYSYLGEIYGEKGDAARAATNFMKAAEIRPQDPAPALRLALLQVEKDPALAVQTLTEALGRIPDDPRLIEMLAYVHFIQKNYVQAVEYFGKAEKAILKTREPDRINPTFYFNFAIARQMAGQLDEAAALLNAAFIRNPAYLDAYLQYAFRQKDDAVRQSAITILEKVGQIQPDQPNVYVYLGLLNSYLKSYKAAVSAFEKAESLVEDSPRKEEILDAHFYFWYAAACEREGQFERAEELFGRCVALDPDHAEAYNYLAYMWAEKGIKLERALDYIQKALKLNPSSGAFIDTLGWIYYMQGQYKDAYQEIHRAAELIPDDPTIVEHLGDVLYKLGDEKQALPHWRRSFVLDPDNRELGEKLTGLGVDLEPLRKEAEEVRRQNALKKDTPEEEDTGDEVEPASEGLVPLLTVPDEDESANEPPDTEPPEEEFPPDLME
jgi:tetratricopeptide (TPR) repeat protein